MTYRRNTIKGDTDTFMNEVRDSIAANILGILT